MKTAKNSPILLGLLFALHANAADRLSENRFSVNVQNSDVRNLLTLVAAQTGLQLRAPSDLDLLVTVKQENATAREILDRLTQDQEIEYTVVGDQLRITKRGIGTQGAIGNVHHVALKFANAVDAVRKVTQLIPTTEKLIIDEQANALMFVGSDQSWQKIAEVIAFLDIAPMQVLIEARIVETSNQFLREIGLSLNGSSANGRNIASTSNPIATSPPNLLYNSILGALTGSHLDLKLAAAETRGEARIISRPKVLTLNNQQAKIESGTSIYVKTLSTAISNPVVGNGSVSTGVPGLAATSGITTLNAGLTLDILPTVVGSDRIRLTIKINNSTPDTSNSVDGIPTIQNNSASTSIIVKSGETAIIAGLVKQSNSNSVTGVPFLSSIPLLGGLFRSTSRTDRNNELVIFITPTLENGQVSVTSPLTGSL